MYQNAPSGSRGQTGMNGSSYGGMGSSSQQARRATNQMLAPAKSGGGMMAMGSSQSHLLAPDAGIQRKNNKAMAQLAPLDHNPMALREPST